MLLYHIPTKQAVFRLKERSFLWVGKEGKEVLNFPLSLSAFCTVPLLPWWRLPLRARGNYPKREMFGMKKKIYTDSRMFNSSPPMSKGQAMIAFFFYAVFNLNKKILP